jgi:WD40 repeat protein
MKMRLLLIIAILFQVSIANCQTNPKEFPVLKGKYFGQTPPGDTAKIFAKDIISVKGRFEFGVSFSPNGKELLVGAQENDTAFIIYTRLTSNGWINPKRISLSNGKFTNEMEPFFTPDGKQIFFAPFNEWEGIRLWSVDNSPQGLMNPKIIDAIVASFPAFYPNSAANGTLYYSNIVDRKIYKAKFQNGKYCTPELVGFPFGFHCFIAADESFALIDGDLNGLGKSDICLVFKNKVGQWGKPINLGKRVNSEYSETCPSLSYDGRYIFFSRYNEVNELSDIYWVSAKIIEELRPK